MPSMISLLALLAAAPAPQDDVATDLVRATWQDCAQCHFAPDKSVVHDARWIGLNETTTCLTGDAATPENRARMMAFLRGGMAPLPPLYRGVPRTDEGTLAPESSGWVDLPGSEGSVYLRVAADASAEADAPAKFVRVVWSATEEGSRVALPGGAYQIIGYSFYREGEGGTRWTASATVQEGQEPDKIEVEPAAKAVALPIETTVLPDLSAVADGDTLELQFQLRNVAGDRMTLTRDGDLVEPRWVALEAEGGAELASGQFTPS